MSEMRHINLLCLFNMVVCHNEAGAVNLRRFCVSTVSASDFGVSSETWTSSGASNWHVIQIRSTTFGVANEVTDACHLSPATG